MLTATCEFKKSARFDFAPWANVTHLSHSKALSFPPRGATQTH